MPGHFNDQNTRGAPRQALRASILFSTLQEDAVEALIDNISLVVLRKNEVLFEQGDPANNIFLLNDGQLKLSRYSQSGLEKIIEFVSPGESFAEALMFSRKEEFPVTATALEASEIWCINSKQYYSLLKGSPDACFAVMAEMSRRLHAQLAEIDSLALHTATLRLVYFLLNESNNFEQGSSTVNLRVSNVVLASRLSIRPETLSRIFAKLSQDGLLAIDERRVKILNWPALEKILLEG